MKKIEKLYENKKIRIFEKNKELYFSISDICKCLGLTNVTETIRTIEKDDVSTTEVIDSIGRRQEIIIVTESALYECVFRSKKEIAKAFKKWVTHEILPSIRKTGKYSIPEKIKELSTKNRNMLTDEWSEHGIEKPHEYIQLTLQEYKALGIEKRKKEMTKQEILRLSALEAMESLKLFEDQAINGYYDCKDSLHNTAKIVETVSKRKKIEYKKEEK